MTAVSLSLSPALLVISFLFIFAKRFNAGKLRPAKIAVCGQVMQQVAAGLRQELGQDKLAITLEELGLAPAASLTVQVRHHDMDAPLQSSSRCTTPPFESKYDSSRVMLLFQIWLQD